MKQPCGCRQSRSVMLYADGELDADHIVEVEMHLSKCEPCAEHLELVRAMRASARRCRIKAPDALRARLCGAMMKEAAGSSSRETGPLAFLERRRTDAPETVDAIAPSSDRQHQGVQNQGAARPRLIPMRYAVAMAAAAGVAFAMGAIRGEGDAVEATQAGATRPMTSAASVSIGNNRFDELLDELVALHADPLPPETTNPEELRRFDPVVGVPVRKPAFQPFNADFNGARVHSVRNRRAAILQFSTQDGRRITMYVFNPEAMPLETRVLDSRVVQRKPVFVGKLRGYSVAATQDSGVGYAVATDLDNEKSAEMVLAALGY